MKFCGGYLLRFDKLLYPQKVLHFSSAFDQGSIPAHKSKTLRDIKSKLLAKNIVQLNKLKGVLAMSISTVLERVSFLGYQSDHEFQRQRALEDYEILDSAVEEAYDSLTQITAELCGVPISLITFIDNDRQWIKSHYGFKVKETTRDIAFCNHAINTPDNLFVVPNTLEDARFKDNPLVLLEPQIRFYAGAPLVTSTGYALGTICLIDNKPGKLTERQQKNLRALAKQVMMLLELRKKNKLLSIKQEALEKRNDELKKFAYVVSHDIKSPLNNISALGNLLIETLKDTIDASSLQHLKYVMLSAENLKSLVDGILGYYRSDALVCEQKALVNVPELLKSVTGLYCNQAEIILKSTGDHQEVMSNVAALKQILLNLISNGIKYNDSPVPKITIQFKADYQMFSFEVSDNGRGIPKGQQGKVFELFSTLGTVDRYYKAGTGIGLASVSKLVYNLGGQLELNSTPGEGSTFKLTFPCAQKVLEKY
jgi:signal transduction histidine kinase